MMLRNFLGSATAIGLLSVSGLASAEDAPRPAVSANGHASGFMVQGRLQAQGGLPYVGGGPGFLVGYQGPSFALGLGLGLTRVGVSAGKEGSGSLTLFQVLPTAIVDVWHSSDGRARANLIGGIGYGRGSLQVTNTSESCSPAAPGGVSTCTTQNEQQKASVGFLPFMLGFGGDYYLSRNFALGTEFGVQAAFSTGLSTTDNSVTRDVDGSGNLQLAYGALRATLVLGD
jgi:hypothetical protein